MADQPFWGSLVHQLGVSPRPIPQKRLTADGLAQAITTALQDETMKRQAAGLGEKIRAEEGVARAVKSSAQPWSNPLAPGNRGIPTMTIMSRLIADPLCGPKP